MVSNSVLSKNPLFSEMAEKEIETALGVFSANSSFYEKGTIIASSGCLQRFGLVIFGTVQVSFTDIDGNEVLMASVGSGDTFGESMCWLRTNEIPVTITALCDSQILWLSPEALRSKEDCEFVRELRNRFVSMLASKTLSMNDRIQ